MNNYLVINYLENEIYSLNKVKTDFEENEYQTSSITCKDRRDLLETLMEIIKEELESEEII